MKDCAGIITRMGRAGAPRRPAAIRARHGADPPFNAETGRHNMMPASLAPQTDVPSGPVHPPEVAAAGMRLLQPHHIPRLELRRLDFYCHPCSISSSVRLMASRISAAALRAASA